MTTTFRKNTELCKKRGYDMELLKTAIHLLEISGRLPKEYQNDQAVVLLFTGTGTHVDLFEKGKKR